MSKFTFKRGIKDKKFIFALNELRKDENSFWSKIVKDKDLYIAIREEYINVYYKGNSICKLSYDKNNGIIVGQTHYKYLLKPDLKNVYVSMDNGKFDYELPLIKSMSDIDLIKKASSNYAGEEKSGVHSLLKTWKNVIDVEITFGKEDENTGNKKTDRIDFLALELNNQQINLVFYEAKHFSNKEIRAQSLPPVIEQINKYEQDLRKHETEILESYRIVCKNRSDLGIVEDRDLINNIVNGENLSIDVEPKLVIFGFDQDQKDGKVWGNHKQKLENTIGSKRLILKGKP